MNVEKKFRRWGIKQCAEEIKVRDTDIAFFCVKKYGHKGKHQIHMDEGEISYIRNRMKGLIADQKKAMRKNKK